MSSRSYRMGRAVSPSPTNCPRTPEAGSGKRVLRPGARPGDCKPGIHPGCGCTPVVLLVKTGLPCVTVTLCPALRPWPSLPSSWVHILRPALLSKQHRQGGCAQRAGGERLRHLLCPPLPTGLRLGQDLCPPVSTARGVAATLQPLGSGSTPPPPCHSDRGGHGSPGSPNPAAPVSVRQTLSSEGCGWLTSPLPGVLAADPQGQEDSGEGGRGWDTANQPGQPQTFTAPRCWDLTNSATVSELRGVGVHPAPAPEVTGRMYVEAGERRFPPTRKRCTVHLVCACPHVPGLRLGASYPSGDLNTQLPGSLASRHGAGPPPGKRGKAHSDCCPRAPEFRVWGAPSVTAPGRVWPPARPP
ncbi:cortexin domain-containing 1 protein isoform 1-T1 [Molossus nigricans]